LKTHLTLGLTLAGLFLQGAARADGLCKPSPRTDAATIPLTIDAQDKTGGKMLLAATMMLEVGKVDAHKARAASEPCDLGKMQVAGGGWTFSGGDGAFVRRVTSPDDRAPVASVYPVMDLIAARQASTNHTPPPPIRYLLITSLGSVDALWTAYDAVPSDAQLSKDLDAAISGRSSPAASVDVATKTINVFVSHPQG
jgi:hypothetical protein